MQAEREDFEAAKPKKTEERTNLVYMAQAAVRMEAVTGDSAWDMYISYIEQAINVAKAQRAQYLDALTSHKLVNQDQIAMIKNEILIRSTRITDLEWVISMPSELKKVGSVAKEKLAQMDVESDEGGQSDAA